MSRKKNKKKMNPNNTHLTQPIKMATKKHGATLSGTVNPKSGDTLEEVIVKFEYGTDIGYGQEALLANLPAGNEPIPVSVDITDLEPETEYHFRLVAENDLGESVSDDMVFTTLGDVTLEHTTPEVTVLAATNIT